MMKKGTQVRNIISHKKFLERKALNEEIEQAIFYFLCCYRDMQIFNNFFPFYVWMRTKTL